MYPYFYTGRNKTQLFPPIGIGILSAILKKKGIDVEKLDCTFMTQEEAIRAAEKYKPDVTGIYIMTTLAKNVIELLEKLRVVNPESLYTAGSPLPSLYPDKFAERFDYVFQGEAANSYPDFCLDYLNGRSKFEFAEHMRPERYPGIYSLRPRFMNSPAKHLTKEEIDGCPITDRDGFNHEKYQEICYQYTGKKTATIMTSFNCPYSCDFCSKPIFGNQVRFRSIDRIFEEIRDITSYGYDSLWISDDLFTYDAEFLKSFCLRMIAF